MRLDGCIGFLPVECSGIPHHEGADYENEHYPMGAGIITSEAGEKLRNGETCLAASESKTRRIR